MSSSQNALDQYNALKLTSVQKGSFDKFKILLEEHIEDMAVNNMAMATDEKTLKLSLFNKLPHKVYKHIFLNITKYESMSYKQTLEDLAAQAALIESHASKLQKSNNRQVNNANSNSNSEKKSIPGTIGGHKVNNEGWINAEAWKKMTKDEKEKFWAAKKKLRESGVGFPNNRSDEKSDAEKLKAANRQINKLQQQVKEGKDDSNESNSTETSNETANLNKLTLAEVLKKMPAASKDKTIAYVKSKINMTRTISLSSPSHLSRVNNLQQDTGRAYIIVDGGADTGMKGGKTSMTLEITERKVNVSGYDDHHTTEDLSIGTTASKVVDEDGNEIILIENEQIINDKQDNSIMSVNQARAFGVDVDDCPSMHNRGGAPGRCNMIVEDRTIPFLYAKNLVLLEATKPTKAELRRLPYVIITSGLDWNPDRVGDNHISTTWTPLEDGDLGIEADEEHVIVKDRLTHNINIMHSSHLMQEQQGQVDIDVLDDDSLMDLPPLIARSRDDDDLSIDSNDTDTTATLSLGDTEYDSDVDNQSISNEQTDDQEASFTQGESEDKPDKDSLFSDDLE